MRVYWWQAGLHLEPESKEERAALGRLGEFFSGLGFLGDPDDQLPEAGKASHVVETGPLDPPDNKESVASGVHVLPEAVR